MIEDFNVVVRRTTFVGGTIKCEVQDITVIDPHKDPAPEVPDATLVVAAEPATPAPKELPDDPDACTLCEIVEDALNEKAKATAASRRFSSRVQAKPTAPRQQSSAREQDQSTPAPRQLTSSAGRRFGRS